MEYQNRIVYDAADLVQKIEGKLDELKVFQFDSRYRMLLGDAFVKHMNTWERNIRNRKDDPFTLVVCGEFKRGKSSLINALLGEDVVTTNVTTETVTLNKISYGTHANEAILSGGRRLLLSDEDLQRDNLEKLSKELGEPLQQIEIRRPIEFLKQVTIIDTPGLGDALKDFSEMVEQALSQADAVIYVFNINYPLSQTEQLFLKTQILPQKYTELFLIGNYADILKDQSAYERMAELVEQRICDLLPGQEFWMLSALDERCMQMEEERPNETLQELLGEKFQIFRTKLARLIEEKREMVLPDRMQRLMYGMAEDLGEQLAAMQEGLQMSTKDVQEAMDSLNKQCETQAEEQKEAARKIDAEVRSMQSDTIVWMNDLLDRMQAEAENLPGVTVADIKKYYTFYCIDMLQDAINRCVEQHTVLLYDMLDGISFELTKGLTKGKKTDEYHFRFALDNHTWTKGDNFSYVVSHVGIGALSIVADAIAGTMREKEMAKQTPDLQKMILSQFPGLRNSALKAVDDTYDKMTQNVQKQLDEYYNDKVRQAKEKVEQSAMVARQDAEKKEEVRIAIEQISAVLEDMQQSV